MELYIKQNKFNLLNYKYEISVEGKLIFIAKANRVLIPSFRKIFLYDCKGSDIYKLIQRNVLKLIIEYIPFFPYVFGVCPYILFNGENKCGFIQKQPNKQEDASGIIENKNTVIYQCSGNKIAILSNGKQVGLIKRNPWKEGDGDKYVVLYDKNFNRELISIITIFSDIIFHTNDGQYTSSSWESTIRHGYEQYENWVPEDK